MKYSEISKHISGWDITNTTLDPGGVYLFLCDCGHVAMTSVIKRSEVMQGFPFVKGTVCDIYCPKCGSDKLTYHPLICICKCGHYIKLYYKEIALFIETNGISDDEIYNAEWKHVIGGEHRRRCYDCDCDDPLPRKTLYEYPICPHCNTDYTEEHHD